MIVLACGEPDTMGSICGYVSFNRPSARSVFNCLNRMRHRGAAFFGLYADGQVRESRRLQDLKWTRRANICLAYSKLNVTGRHSRCSESSNQRLYLVLDGCFHNDKELGSLLREPRGRSTDEDREVLLRFIGELYDGNLVKAVRSALTMMAGVYALAVTDGKRVMLARDPVGTKPLYYTEKQRTIYFSSEKKAIWDFNKNVKSVRPGTMVEISGRGTRTHLGVRLEHPPIDIVDFREAAHLYKDSLMEAVRRHLRGVEDEAVGVIFSGGVDSTLIAKILKDLGKRARCYCVGTDGSEDLYFAEYAAEALDLELQTITVDQTMIEKVLPEVIRCIEINGPVQVETAIPVYLAAKKASEDGIRVLFNGQGPDELFAGYPWYPAIAQKDGYVRLHAKLWQDVALSYADTLEREDKAAMAHGVELKVPYLDLDLVRIAMRTSPSLKIRDAEDKRELGKWIHREVALLLGVPRVISHREKNGAQHGSGVHVEVERIAKRRFHAKYFRRSEVKDRGSNYRYCRAQYGSREELAYLYELGAILRR